MNSKHYHAPVSPASTRLRCPVCQEAVYSLAGIHPQCAVKLYDPPKPKVKPPGPAPIVAQEPATLSPAEAGVAVEPSAT